MSYRLNSINVKFLLLCCSSTNPGLIGMTSTCPISCMILVVPLFSCYVSVLTVSRPSFFSCIMPVNSQSSAGAISLIVIVVGRYSMRLASFLLYNNEYGGWDYKLPLESLISFIGRYSAGRRSTHSQPIVVVFQRKLLCKWYLVSSFGFFLCSRCILWFALRTTSAFAWLLRRSFGFSY